MGARRGQRDRLDRTCLFFRPRDLQDARVRNSDRVASRLTNVGASRSCLLTAKGLSTGEQHERALALAKVRDEADVLRRTG